MRICKDCGHIFETISFNCENCGSVNIEEANSAVGIKKNDLKKLVLPSGKTIKKILFFVAIILFVILAMPAGVDKSTASIIGLLLAPLVNYIYDRFVK